ncbi:MAG: TerD family protein [Oscillospiraceae bacterium]|jgi:tellurium resistance protein TerD|nr:TerD family protein [Oscillospiraceae bacterium]
MSVSLSKGQKVSLDKSTRYALIGLGWDTNRYNGGFDFDLDAAAFLLTANGKCRRDDDFIFYNNLKSENGAVTHTGDNLTGAGDGDDEVILVDLSKVPADITKIAFTVTIHDAKARAQNFGQVANAYVRVASQSTPEDMQGVEQFRYDLGEDFSVETALVVAEIYRYNSEWKFNAVGAGYSGGLKALCDSFGINAG